MKLIGKTNAARLAGVTFIFISALVLVSNAFIVTAQPTSPNLIVNSNFEFGNTGFASDYTFSPGDIVPPAVYDVLSDPASAHSLASSFGDHTTGSGLMMAVNGATTAGLTVWTQTVTVTPNTDYDFSVWVTSWYPSVPAQLQLMINSNPVGAFTAPSTPGLWQQFATSWNSGSNTTAMIEIVNSNTAFGGNDFALDDLAFVATLKVVEIDIKPGSDPNCFNNNGNGVIPVAILTTADFDASTVDPFSVSLDGAGARVKGKSGKAGSLEDVDGDGDLDLIVQIEDQDGAYSSGDTVATLTGQTYSGEAIAGSDSICIVP